MKKIILAFLVIFVANLGCKKLDDGDKPCACSPVMEPPLTLIIKGANDVDMLNPNSANAFSSNDIKLYYLDTNGTQRQLTFYIKPNFTVDNNKFDFYQLHSSEIVRLATSLTKDFYLKLGQNEPFKINIEKNKDSFKLAKLTVNGVEKLPETGAISKYIPNIYYLDFN